MTDTDAHIPLGDVFDFEGEPRTVRRDYDTIVIPAMQVGRDGIAALRKLLDDGEAEIRAYEAREAAEVDEGETVTDTTEGPCDLCGIRRPPGKLMRWCIGGEWLWICVDRHEDAERPLAILQKAEG